MFILHLGEWLQALSVGKALETGSAYKESCPDMLINSTWPELLGYFQVEHHGVSWMDQRRGRYPKAVSDEIWRWEMEGDPRVGSTAREALPATECADAETSRTTITSW